MAHGTAEPLGAAGQAKAPPDLATMRATAAAVLGPDDGPDALPPSATGLDTLDGTLRGHLQLLIPDVQRVAGSRRKDVQTYCALACVGEARGKLTVATDGPPPVRVRHVRRLARVLLALCEHYERLTGSGETAEQAALRLLGEHSSTCPTCRTRDDRGNADVPCAEADHLYDAWRQTRRGVFASAG
ncbi:DUF6415 family natural product biosynthesis protein [Streptomyces nigra]|uniref:DUF6415 family natural product biosynthesis protein n=1 Tax=Streptomyces nigra TaxID=1827580 RepID=UPI00380CE325